MNSRRLHWGIVLALMLIHWPNATAEAKRIEKPDITVPGGNCPGLPPPSLLVWTHVPSTPILVAFLWTSGGFPLNPSISPPPVAMDIRVPAFLTGPTECVLRVTPGVQYTIQAATQYPCFGGNAQLTLIEAIDCPEMSLQQLSQGSSSSCSPLVIDFGEVVFGDSAEAWLPMPEKGGNPLSRTSVLPCGEYSVVGQHVRYKPTINDSPLGILDLGCGRAYLIGSGIGPRLLWHDADEIARARLDGTLVESIASSAPHVDFAVDYANAKLYRAESNATSGSIIVSGLTGGGGSPIVPGGRPWSIALDTRFGKVYWTDVPEGAAPAIRRANLNGSMMEVLPIAFSAANPPDIAVDPVAQRIYWTVVGGTNAIRRANFDGSNPLDIVSFAGGGDPQIALDLRNGRIYWSQGSSIRRAYLDGSNVQTLLTPGLVAAGALAIDAGENKLYWADTGTNSIHRVTVGGGDAEEVVTGATGLNALALLLPLSEPERIYWGEEFVGGIRSRRKDGVGGSSQMYGGLLIDAVDMALDPDAGKLYWVDGATVGLRRGDVNGNASTVENIVNGLASPDGLALDVAGGKVYWIDSGSSAVAIRRANLDGSALEDLVNEGWTAFAIAVDGAGGKMYWTATEFGQPGLTGIYRANLNGSGVVLLVPVLQSPKGIALDVHGGKIYYIDTFSGQERIQRANLDGSGIETLVPAAGQPLNRLQLDLGARKMYWSIGGSTPMIRRANLDGSGLEFFAASGSPGGIAVTPRAGYPLPSAVEDLAPPVSQIQLDAPRPNPFNPSTTISFVHAGGALDLAVYDVRGRLVRTLVAGDEAAGRQVVTWEGTNHRGISMPSGLYIVKLRSQGQQRSVKAVLVR